MSQTNNFCRYDTQQKRFLISDVKIFWNIFKYDPTGKSERIPFTEEIRLENFFQQTI